MRTLALTLLAALLAAAAASADVVVLRDRTILEGEAKRDGEQISVAGRTTPLDEVLLWEGTDGVPQNDPTLRNHLRALDALHDRELLARSRELLAKAIEAKAGGSARRLLTSAERLDMDPAEVEALAKQIEGLPDDKQPEFELQGDKSFARLLGERAKANGAEDDKQRGLELLREALLFDPESEDLLLILDEVGPSIQRGRRRPRRSDIVRARPMKRVWLDWMVDVLPSKFGRIRLLDNRHVELERAKALWKIRDPDTGEWKETPIHGVETSEIVFLTSMTRTDIVKSCVSLARFTARTLEQMFQTDAPKRGTSDPLVIYLYGDKAQYVALSGRGRGEAPNPTIAMSAGHYTSTENVSRFYWPGMERWKSVKETFVHELTHHWIQERNPRWARTEQPTMEDSVQVPGVWIVEGMAVFMQGTRFDLERGTWDLFNPKATYLDATQAIGTAGNLIDWKKQLTITKVELHSKVDTQFPQGYYKGRWNLRAFPMNEMVLFYQQAGATCAYLYFAEGGKYREKLLDYVTAYYTGKKEQTAIQTAFGISEAELGKRVEEFARKVCLEGWRPKAK